MFHCKSLTYCVSSGVELGMIYLRCRDCNFQSAATFSSNCTLELLNARAGTKRNLLFKSIDEESVDTTVNLARKQLVRL